MKVLLVNPYFPNSYWSGRAALQFARRKSLIPPLPLITVAAMLPDDWECRLVDLNIEDLHDEDLAWADVVMLTAMLVQRDSLREILKRCRHIGVKTVVGGPYPTSIPGEVEDLADHLALGEGENIVPRLAADLAAGRAEPVYEEKGKPEMELCPVPRYDLLKVDQYHQMAIQYSRGCPFTCEFCDIIVLYGRVPRVKTAEQVVTELEAIRKTGFRGDVFFVDDNFIGNKNAVLKLLPHVERWRRESRAPMEFYTEASMNLADDQRLVDAMTRSGFTAVFMGIESPSPEALKETKKLQNLRRDIAQQIHGLLESGLDVWAGFILGFDSDGPSIFDEMIHLVERSAIPYAMVGMLTALPNTPLHDRLSKEGRLRDETSTGDQFGLSNVITKLPALEMIRGYQRVLETLYSPENYFRRCQENLKHWKPTPGGRKPIALQDFGNAWRAIKTQAFKEPYRASYRRFLGWVLRNEPTKLARALAQGATGHHYIRYTQDVVLPALEESARKVAAGRPMGAVSVG